MDPELKDCRVFARVVRAACAPADAHGGHLRNAERLRLDDTFGVSFMRARTDEEEIAEWLRAFNTGRFVREPVGHWIRRLPFRQVEAGPRRGTNGLFGAGSGQRGNLGRAGQ